MTDYTDIAAQELDDMKDIGWALLQVLGWIAGLAFGLALWMVFTYGV